MALDAFALIALMIALGKAFSYFGLLGDGAADALNRVVLYVCLPAAVLRYAPRLEFDPALLGLIATPWLLLAASVALVSLAARALRFNDGERAVLLLLVPLGNTSFLGFPLIEALLGRDALQYAVAYDQFGTFLMLSTWGLWVLARYGGDSPPTLREIGLRVLRFPPFVALIVALTVMPAEPHPVIATVLQRLADALLPIVTLAVGLMLKLKLPRREVAPLAFGLACKLVLLPPLAWLFLAAIDPAPLALRAGVLESAMAPMITAAALAASHRLAPALASAMVGYGILLSMATLPVWAWLLS